MKNHDGFTMRWMLVLLMAILGCGLHAGDFDPGKSPTQAAFMSLFVPGAGQLYNESYYKAGSVILIEGILIGLLIHDHNETEKAYDKAMSAYGEEYNYWADRYYKYYDRRQNDMWWLGTTMLLSAIDAYVDAHLHNYDTLREDIHLRFEKDKVMISWEF